MRLLGIDPGSKHIGFGVIDKIDIRYKYISSGYINISREKSLINKIGIIASNINEIISNYNPDQIALEKIFVNINPAGTLTLGQARGAIIAIVAMSNLPIFEYTALQVKKAVVGHGKAAKIQVQDMVTRLLSLSATPQADAADALAVALTHILRNKF